MLESSIARCSFFACLQQTCQTQQVAGVEIPQWNLISALILQCERIDLCRFSPLLAFKCVLLVIELTEFHYVAQLIANAKRQSLC